MGFSAIIRLVMNILAIQNGCKYAEAFRAHRIHGYMPDFKVLP